MAKFTGNDVRDIRKKHRMTRKELAEELGVSAVTIEKWEQHGDKTIRSKYHEKLANIGGIGTAGVIAGMLVAPALLAPAAILGGGVGVAALLTDDGLDKATKLLNQLKRLTPEERETLINLTRKMNDD